MDMNELLYRHQLALMTVRTSRSDSAAAKAADLAEDISHQINVYRSAPKLPPAVLSVQTLLEVSANSN